jgi:predicted RNA binding protein YcfA (HicA-like mRNA interferase family)
MKRIPQWAAAVLAAALLAGGCASTEGFQYARDVGSHGQTEKAQAQGEVLVVWKFGTQEWVSTMCAKRLDQGVVHGCAMRDPGSDRCLLILVQPTDYQDRDRLAVMGHELWHCQGSRHA